MNTINKLILNLLAGILLAVGFASCSDDDNYGEAVSISKIYLEDATSEVPDREISFARLGQMLRLEGSGFSNVRKVYINGYDTYFNPTLVSDNSMIIRVSYDTPTIDAQESERNTIRMVNDGNTTTYKFDIRSASPSITRISNTMPNVGEEILVFGSGLTEVSEVIFPGEIIVTEGITSDEDGDFFTVRMPEGVSENGGSLFVTGSNGGAYSPAYFNCKTGVILDFDENGSQGFWGWSETGSMINDEDLESETIGKGNLSQGNYAAHHPARKTEAFPAATNRNSEVWTAGNDVDDWRSQFSSAIPTTTLASQVAFQFDMHVDGRWSESGFLKIVLINNFNGGEWAGACYNYVPWLQNGTVVPYESPGWVTITIPFSHFYAFSEGDFTFEDILETRENANYKNFGFYFENSDFNLSQITKNESDAETEFTSSPSNTKVYTDNWRVVSLETPVYSDFPSEEIEN